MSPAHVWREGREKGETVDVPVRQEDKKADNHSFVSVNESPQQLGNQDERHRQDTTNARNKKQPGSKERGEKKEGEKENGERESRTSKLK